MKERLRIPAADILNKHGGEAEKRVSEKVYGRNREAPKTLRLKTITGGQKQQKSIPLLSQRWSQEVTSVQQRRVHAANVMVESVHRHGQP